MSVAASSRARAHHRPPPGRRRAVGCAVLVALTAALGLAGLAVPTPATAAPITASPTASAPAAPAPAAAAGDTDVCAPTGPLAPGVSRCFAVQHTALVRDARTGVMRPAATTSGPVGVTPTALRKAYGVDGLTPPAGTTVAVVDAFDDPSAEADLGVFRSQFGITPCTSSNGCFRKVDQRGNRVPTGSAKPSTSPPTPDRKWSVEIGLDLAAVSAICPACQILLVEADSADDYTGLGPAMQTAYALGARVITNSFGAQEADDPAHGRTQASLDAGPWGHADAAVFAATGDNGWQNGSGPADTQGFVNYPASSPAVVAVGGTSWTSTDPYGVPTSTAWASGGSGCSLLEARPAAQSAAFAAAGLDPDPADGGSYCTRPPGYGGGPARAVADVAALADPSAPGFPVYLSSGTAAAGWNRMGGTSLAAPVVAAIQALAGPRPGDLPAPAGVYATHPDGGVADVTSGADDVGPGSTAATGSGCDGHLICRAASGWDGPTGVGEPRGLALLRGVLHTPVTTAVPLQQVTVTGTGYRPGETVLLSSGSTVLGGPLTADSTGTVSTTVTVPAKAARTYPLIGVGQTSHVVQTTALTVPPAAVTVPSNSVVPLATVTPTATGFGAREQVRFTVSGGATVAATADASGTATPARGLAVPATAATSVTVTARGVTTGRVATQVLPVPPAALAASPPTLLPGGTASLLGTGFGAGEAVDVTIGSAAPVTVTAAADGSVTGAVTAPADATTSITVGATGEVTGRTATVAVPVPAATLTGSPAVVSPGATTTLRGTGFEPGETVAFTTSAGPVPAVTAAGDGSVAAAVTVPVTAPAGTLAVTATGGTTGRSATARLTVPAAVVNAPATVAAGGTATVSLTGFAPGETVAFAVDPARQAAVPAPVTVRSDGSGTAALTASATACPAAVTVTATGQQSGRTAVAAVTVTPAAVLANGCTLAAGGTLTSPSGQYRLTLQADGNLVEYGNGRALWWTGTSGAGATLAMQSDGNLVVYVPSPSGGAVARWATYRYGAGASLAVGDDGALVVTAGGRTIWSSGTVVDRLTAPSQLLPGWWLRSANGAYTLVLQPDGNLVEYDAAHRAVWNTRSWGSTNPELDLQTDGNLVLYTANGVRFATYVYGSGNVVVVQDDGNIVEYSASGRALWNSYGF